MAIQIVVVVVVVWSFNKHKTIPDPASGNPDEDLKVSGDLLPMSSEKEPIILDPRHQPIVWYEEFPQTPKGSLNISPYLFIEGKFN